MKIATVVFFLILATLSGCDGDKTESKRFILSGEKHDYYAQIVTIIDKETGKEYLLYNNRKFAERNTPIEATETESTKVKTVFVDKATGKEYIMTPKEGK